MHRLVFPRALRRPLLSHATGRVAVLTSYRLKTDGNDTYVSQSARDRSKLSEKESWLEAELDENINTPEERYAHKKEMENIKAMIAAMGAGHEQKLSAAKAERVAEINKLKKQMKEIEERIKNVEK